MFLLLLIDYLCVLASVIADLISGLRKARLRGENALPPALDERLTKSAVTTLHCSP